MRSQLTTLVLAGIAAVLPLAVPNSQKPEQLPPSRADFVGVFQARLVGFSRDPIRCPDTHPNLLSFTGEAQTTLGRATFQQSHCEDDTHSSFRRGEQTITFDDGQMLFGTYGGSILPTPTTPFDQRVIVDGFYRNTGGTGRFEHVRGHGISAGVVDITNGSAIVTVSGTL